jgi:AraC-like DNA-binding protein
LRHTINTSIAGWSFALARALEDYGIDALQVFREAGIELDEVPSAAARLPVSSVQQVWRYAAEHTDGYFGITVSAYLGPASFHGLGFALWSSSTLKDFLERFIRYRCVLSHAFFCELLEEDDCYRLTLVDERSIKSTITKDAALSYVVRMARQLGDPEFAPSLVRTTVVKNDVSGRLRDFYAADVEYASMDHALLFSKDALARPLRFGNPDLAAQQDAIVERYIAELGLISEYMMRVKTTIHSLLSSDNVRIELVAESLNVTVRTLQRRLSAEQSSYNHLLDQVRHQLAMEYIKDPATNATEIAFKLGFNDSGSFGRSFKRWTNQSFSQFRSNAGKE